MLYDVIIIGGGPAGYICAIRAAQLGLKVACVERRATLGGTCLNVGCIPSKALLHASEQYAHLPALAAFGVTVKNAQINLAAMMAYKTSVVAANAAGIDFLLKKNGVDRILGEARIMARGSVAVGQTVYAARNIAIATGSIPSTLPNIEIDEKRIVTSTGALSLSAIPKTMTVIGAGAIGLEIGSIWSRLGTKVQVVEYADTILPTMDRALQYEARKILEKQGLIFRLSSKITTAKASTKDVSFTLESAAGGKAQTLKTDVVLVAVGRVPYTQGLGLEALGVEQDTRGRVVVNAGFETSVEGLYAIGDVIHGPMLAHKAEEDGVALAEILAGRTGHVEYNLVPAVVYTSPEIASVGRTQEDLKAAGIAFKVGTFPFSASGRARAMGNTTGFVKILADSITDRLLGVHIIGAGAGEMIAEAALAMAFEGTAEDIARTCHAHPTLAEALKEAALAVSGRAIHTG